MIHNIQAFVNYFQFLILTTLAYSFLYLAIWAYGAWFIKWIKEKGGWIELFKWIGRRFEVAFYLLPFAIFFFPLCCGVAGLKYLIQTNDANANADNILAGVILVGLSIIAFVCILTYNHSKNENRDEDSLVALDGVAILFFASLVSGFVL